MDQEELIKSLVLKETRERATSLSFVLSGLFAIYGLTSVDFIRRFVPDISMWNNIWPRLLFCSLPFLLLGVYLNKSKLSDLKKIFVWIGGFTLILHITAWINIWPITLWKSSSILTYVHAANVYLFALVFSTVSPPGRLIIPFTVILLLGFVFPLFFVAYYAGDMVVFKLILNDSAVALVFSIILSTMIDRLRHQIAKLKIQNEMQASQFLGPVLSKAIFQHQGNKLKNIRCQGFVITTDIRDSTVLQQVLGDQWHFFRREYFTLVGRLASKHGGYIQKTAGDGHIINFGIMDYGEDLSDIPGIEAELNRVDERRLLRASDSAFAFLDELLISFQKLSKRHFPNQNLYLGAGIDKGWVERGVQGDSSHVELDVNGDPVNCSYRLQEYSKSVLSELESNDSLIIVSPFASDFITDFSGFTKIMTSKNSIRNYPGIKWVLVKKSATSVQEAESERKTGT